MGGGRGTKHLYNKEEKEEEEGELGNNLTLGTSFVTPFWRDPRPLKTGAQTLLCQTKKKKQMMEVTGLDSETN